jgi:polysaccharide biosynthesis protein PslF
MTSATPHRSTTRSRQYRIGLLSTYQPKLCGLATFSAALATELRRTANHVDVVRIVDIREPAADSSMVRASLVNGSPASVRAAAVVLSRCDVAVIQHEYGIYGGEDGDEVLDLLAALDVPAIVVLHTVPLTPTPHQQTVLEEVCRLADRVVVMTTTAGDRLLASYAVDAAKVVTIPHGAATASLDPWDLAKRGGARRPQLLTWGLLGPGKGIEHTIDALGMLRDIRPRVRYTIAGVTHPKVFAREGDRYRESLIRRSWVRGVADCVTFDDTYRDVAELTRFVAGASVVVLPYDSRDQVTSGVLVDAIAAGRPVIATAFPHAVELLASGAGIVVPHADPLALADAIRSTVSNPEALESMAAEARRLAPSLGWSAVARQYLGLCADVMQVAEAVAM